MLTHCSSTAKTAMSRLFRLRSWQRKSRALCRPWRTHSLCSYTDLSSTNTTLRSCASNLYFWKLICLTANSVIGTQSQRLRRSANYRALNLESASLMCLKWPFGTSWSKRYSIHSTSSKFLRWLFGCMTIIECTRVAFFSFQLSLSPFKWLKTCKIMRRSERWLDTLAIFSWELKLGEISVSKTSRVQSCYQVILS